MTSKVQQKALSSTAASQNPQSQHRKDLQEQLGCKTGSLQKLLRIYII